MTLHDPATRICAQLTQHGYQALFAGGCVRDRVMGLPPVDFDIATDARPDDIARIFPKTIPVGAAFGVMIVLDDDTPFEVATFREDGPYSDGRHPDSVTFRDAEQDALRRDFTINALFYDPATDEVIDYVDGRADIDAKIIRAVGDPDKRFQEDRLRLLRAVRFAARLGFTIEPDTMAAITSMAEAVTETSAERIRDEILKILTEGQARRAFELMDETGLLPHILPEIAALKGVEQPPEFHPEGDVYIHTLMMLEHLAEASPTLALGILLHDIGKPATQTFEDRIRFNNHDKVGSDMARDVCKRLHMSNHDTDRVTWLVGQHMRLATIPNMRESKRIRFIREDGFDELLNLCRIDCLASHRILDTIEWIKDYRANLKPEKIKPAPLLTGDDLIAMGYKPGPRFGEILQAIEDAQLEGALSTKEEAEAHVLQHWQRG
jgi:poly(A) polymerase